MKAFSLLELLVTLSIVGILLSFAVPQYKKYRERAYDLQAATDMRNVALAEELYFMDSERYLSCDNENCNQLPSIRKLSKGTILSVTSEREDHFRVQSSHSKGSGKRYVWDSDEGEEEITNDGR